MVTIDGKTALVYYQPIPKLVKLVDKSIFFDCKNGISLAMVEEQDIPQLLGVIGGCCGGQRKVIHLANQAQYDHWNTGNGGR